MVHDDRRNTGVRLWGKKLRLVLLCGSLQYLVPRSGHCLCAKLNLNETKKGVMSWMQHGRTHHWGGRRVQQPSNKRMPCQNGAMIPHNKVWWHSSLPDAQCGVCAMWARCSHVYRKVHCSVSRLCPYVGQVLMFFVRLRSHLNLIICDASRLTNSGQQEFKSM